MFFTKSMSKLGLLLVALTAAVGCDDDDSAISAGDEDSGTGGAGGMDNGEDANFPGSCGGGGIDFIIDSGLDASIIVEDAGAGDLDASLDAGSEIDAGKDGGQNWPIPDVGTVDDAGTELDAETEQDAASDDASIIVDEDASVIVDASVEDASIDADAYLCVVEDCTEGSSCQTASCEDNTCIYHTIPDCQVCTTAEDCEQTNQFCMQTVCEDGRCHDENIENCDHECGSGYECQPIDCNQVECINHKCDYTRDETCCSSTVSCNTGVCLNNTCVDCIAHEDCAQNPNGSYCTSNECGPARSVSLLISEYVCGSAQNKAIELFNVGELLSDLSVCTIEQRLNGCAETTCTGNDLVSIQLPAVSLGAEQTFVVCHGNFADLSKCNFVLPTTETATSNAPTFVFDGLDGDVISLNCYGNIIDSVGSADPTVARADNMTARRQCYVEQGGVFDPSDWLVLEADAFGGLGERESRCERPANCTIPGEWNNAGVCEPCIAPGCASGSASCTNATDAVCTACIDGYYLLNGTCHACGELPNCETVTCTSESEKTCESCISPYVLKDGTCELLLNCEEHSYYNEATNSCVACESVPGCVDAEHVTCSDATDSKCTECDAEHLLMQNGTCITSCGEHTYYSEATKSCVACESVPGCVDAEHVACSDATDSKCTECDAEHLLMQNGTCITSCEEHSYYNEVTKSCVACELVPGCVDAEHVTCSDATDSKCTECFDGFTLQSTGKCQANCQSNEFYSDTTKVCELCSAVSGCLNRESVTCSNANDSKCTVCAANHHLRQDGTCLAPCASNTYFDVNTESCEQCSPVIGCKDSAHLTCDNGLSSKCTACSAGYSLTATGTCVANCATNEYFDEATEQCTTCAAVEGCLGESYLRCTNATDSQCLVCQTGYNLLANGTCLAPCAAHSYFNRDAQGCVACTDVPGCAGPEYINCSTAKNSRCQQCLPDYNLLGTGKCLEPCDEHSYFNVDDQACTPCTSVANCLDADSVECTTARDSKCTECKPGYNLLKTGKCSDPCLDYFYFDEDFQQCNACPGVDNCIDLEHVTCSGLNDAKCTECSPGYTLTRTGKCFAPCTGNTYLDEASESCKLCTLIEGCKDPVYLTCTSAFDSKCSVCEEGYHLRSDGTCLAPCGDGAYYDEATEACLYCDAVPGCLNQESLACNSANDSICTECAPGYTLLEDGTCRANCPDGQYYNTITDTCSQCAAVPGCSDQSTVTCTSALDSQCPVCSEGYRRLDSGVCQKICASNEYNATLTACSRCQAMSNCAIENTSCTRYGDSVCSECYEGFYPANGGTSCMPCGFNFRGCAAATCTSAQDAVCTECQFGYQKAADGTCVQECPNGVQDCTIYNFCQDISCVNGLCKYDGVSAEGYCEPDGVTWTYCNGISKQSLNCMKDYGQVCSETPAPGCTDGEVSVPENWLCHPERYTDSFCDCGCGAHDPACSTETVSSCERSYCNNETALGIDGRRLYRNVVDSLDNTRCLYTVPSDWTCDPALYNDETCNCGCGVADPDCNNIVTCSD